MMVAGDPGEDQVQAEGYADLAPFTVDTAEHRFTFLQAGHDRLEQLLAMIDGAQTSLRLFFYIYRPDHTGTVVRAALIHAAQRGVDVHLMIDAFGSDAPAAFFEPIVNAGGRFDRFSPRWNVRYLIRNHQKIVIADGSCAMTGGFNIADDYFAPPAANGWADLGIMIEGPVVASFASWFERLESWVAGGEAQFRMIRRIVREWDDGQGAVRLLPGGPTRLTSAWARMARADIARAARLDMVMAYFSPPSSMRRLIRALARRGRARLVMAAKSDNGATIGASRALYASLLRAGAEICEFEPCRLHTKLLVIDDVTYFGTANFDMRSMRLNLELMVRVEDAGLARHMRALIDHMARWSTPVTRELHRRRSTLFNQIRWRLGWFLVSVLDYTVTRRLNLGL